MQLLDIFGEKSPTFIGALMAVFGSSLIGLSYTASKNAHNKLMEDLENAEDDLAVIGIDSEEIVIPVEEESIEDEGSPLIVKYDMTMIMKKPEWWISMIFLIFGEIFNFMAYGFAPTSVIAPLGTLSIISGALSGYFYLGERMKLRSLMGMILSISGAVLIVAFAKSEEPKLDPEAIMEALSQIQFIVFASCMMALVIFFLILEKTPVPGTNKLFGDEFMIIRVALTALFSGFTVLATKAISSLIAISFLTMFTYWISYVLLVVLISNSFLTLYYTNKALSAFDSTLVLPAEFAAYTFCAIFGSAVLYNDFEDASLLQKLVFLLGCLITFSGVYLITTGKDKQGKPVNRPATTFNAAWNVASSPRVELVGHSAGSRPFSFPSKIRNSPFINTGNKRFTMSPNYKLTIPGVHGLSDLFQVLGNTRASLTFQQVVLPGDYEAPEQSSNVGDSIEDNEISGYEIYRKNDDDTSFLIRPVGSRCSSVSNLSIHNPPIAFIDKVSVDTIKEDQPVAYQKDSPKPKRKSRIRSLFSRHSTTH
jgi:MFS family permease